jgi:predicted Rossmann fold flavoprotein
MYDVIVIGAGPAGMMASISASTRNKKVLLIDKNDKVGKKMELTGGSRCNVINLKSIKDFINEIPVNNKVLYSSLNQFGPQDIFDYFVKIGVPLKIEDNDRVFPVSNKSKTIIDALENQLKINNVVINLNEVVEAIENHDIYKIVTTNKNTYRTKAIIISTGGFSYPITGSTGDGHKLAKKMNQPVTKLYPAETFLINKEPLPLAGITIDNVLITFKKNQAIGSLLFTHTGLSGPAIFKISAEVYHELKISKYVTICIDLIPNLTFDQLAVALNNYNSKKEINSFVRDYLPKRLGEYIVNETIPNLKVGITSKTNKQKLFSALKKFEVTIKSTGTIEQSIVTGGGIDMKHINSKTMESLTNKGIYFAGEVLDIHGHTGGYNITIALSTGFVAGKLQ